MQPEDLLSAPDSDPSLLYRLRDGLYTADLLTVAIVHLDLFGRLAERPSTLGEVCESLGLKERPADVMLTLLAALGLLRKDGERFGVTAAARDFLVRGSPQCVTPYYAALKDRPVAADLLTVLRTGQPASWGSVKGKEDWARSMEKADFATGFTAAMDCRGAYLGPALARVLDLRRSRSLLDVGGGSGIYACALAAANPHLRGAVLEKPPVDGIAREAIARRGPSDRVRVEAGDMFREIPAGHDVHLFSNVLHDWDVPEVRVLIEGSFRSLLPGGRIAIHDAHLDREKTGPAWVAEYSVLLMHSTEGRCYSSAEIEGYLEDAGFEEAEMFPTALSRSVITARKR